MFSSSQYSGSRKASMNAYSDVGANAALDGASPHKLVSLLYGALSTQIATARGALARRDIPEKARAITHAARIVEEGLLMPLDLAQGGRIARNLADLYEYMLRQLTLANLKNDDAKLAECARLAETLREGWEGIADEVHSDTKVAA